MYYFDDDGDDNDDRPKIIPQFYYLLTCWINSADVSYVTSKIHKHKYITAEQ
jgi:hypothetical protein